MPTSEAVIRVVYFLELKQSSHIWAEEVIYWLCVHLCDITLENIYHKAVYSYQCSWHKHQRPSCPSLPLPLEFDDLLFQEIRDIHHPAFGFVTLSAFRY